MQKTASNYLICAQRNMEYGIGDLQKKLSIYKTAFKVIDMFLYK